MTDESLAIVCPGAARAAAIGRGDRRETLVASVPWLIAGLIAFPVGVGLTGVALPAFGYLPALGGTEFSLAPFRRLFAEPGLVL